MLAFLIVIKIGMLKLSDVVGREICEYSDIELDAVYSRHFERL